ncbi:hypothetical protein [Sphingobacterium suaedae]|uniref:Uncharacterized protein n=1 Tax=Sphingobacterium suaedae TaxID=1686402 RepID=A0ABW5KJ64_9SPHI
MRKIIYFIILIWNLFASSLAAQQTPTTDSVNFEQQRDRVNTLLEERSRRFGEYDSSLQKKTGIFGIFKTKGDMQKSIDILKQIVLTDNNIFVETKRLLDIKDFESDKNRALAAEYDKQVSAYMKTITKLQDENDRLRLQIDTLDKEDHSSHVLTYVLLIIIAALLFVLYRQYRQYTSKI